MSPPDSINIVAKDYEQWLDAREKDTGKLEKLLALYPSEEMTAYKITKSVKAPSNDLTELIEEIKQGNYQYLQLKYLSKNRVILQVQVNASDIV